MMLSLQLEISMLKEMGLKHPNVEIAIISDNIVFYMKS